MFCVVKTNIIYYVCGVKQSIYIMKTKLNINKKKLFRRAWFLVKEKYYDLLYALKQVWKEMKVYAYEKAVINPISRNRTLLCK